MFNVDFFQFMLDVLRASRPPPVEDSTPLPSLETLHSLQSPGLVVIQLGTRFALNTVARSAHHDLFPNFVETLSELFRDNLPACLWFIDWLATERTLLAELALKAREPKIRVQFCQLVSRALARLAPFESPAFAVEKETADSAVESTASLRMLDVLVTFLEDEAPNNFPRFADYFRVLHEFALLSLAHRRAMVERGLIARLGDFFLGDFSPVKEKNLNRKVYSMGSKQYPPDWGQCLHTLSVLVRACETPAADSQIPPSLIDFGKDQIEPLKFKDEMDERIVRTTDLYVHALSNQFNNEAIAQMMVHWSFEYLAFTESVVQVVLEGVEKANEDSVKPYMHVLTAILSIDDSLKQARFDALFGPQTPKSVSHQVYYFRKRYPKFTYTVLKAVLDLMDENSDFRQFMLTNRQDWTWWDQWLKSYAARRYASAATAHVAERAATFSKLTAIVESANLPLFLAPEGAAADAAASQLAPGAAPGASAGSGSALALGYDPLAIEGVHGDMLTGSRARQFANDVPREHALYPKRGPRSEEEMRTDLESFDVDQILGDDEEGGEIRPGLEVAGMGMTGAQAREMDRLAGQLDRNVRFDDEGEGRMDGKGLLDRGNLMI
eukprot:GABV01000101.1.p1 GENE.GABV01000101.1~~GABV01000101.1.p1  ORF type:complete len:660 (-),score=255.84 GABV01000101.1:21-1850(-)